MEVVRFGRKRTSMRDKFGNSFTVSWTDALSDNKRFSGQNFTLCGRQREETTQRTMIWSSTTS